MPHLPMLSWTGIEINIRKLASKELIPLHVTRPFLIELDEHTFFGEDGLHIFGKVSGYLGTWKSDIRTTPRG